MRLYKLFKELEEWLFNERVRTERRLARMYRSTQTWLLTRMSRFYDAKTGERKKKTSKNRQREALKKDVLQAVNELDAMKERIMREFLVEAYSYAHDWLIWGVEKRSGYEFLDDLRNEQIQKRAVTNPVNKLTLKKTLAKHRKRIIRDVNAVIAKGIANGHTYEQMADDLKRTFDGDYTKALRVVRTEGHRVREQGTYDAASFLIDEGAVISKEWVTMRDRRVRQTAIANHVQMHGQQREISEYFDLGNGAKALFPSASGLPHHDINCRCVTVYTVHAFLKEFKKRNEETFTEKRKRRIREREAA